MEAEGLEIITLELKYCERCGGLWLRQRGAESVYCECCAADLAEFAISPRKKTKPRLPGHPTLEIGHKHKSAAILVCSEGGTA